MNNMNRTRRGRFQTCPYIASTLLAAGIALAMVLTSCGGDDGDEPETVTDLSSSSSEDGGDSSSSSDDADNSSSSSTPNNSSSSSSEPEVSSSSSFETIEIGEQTWMKFNLNVVPNDDGDAAANYWCYGEGDLEQQEVDTNCEKYGRLYDWATAMALLDDCNSTSCSGDIETPYHRGICPEGFHIPTDADWDKLFRTVDGNTGTSSPYESETAGTKLKSSTDWISYNDIPIGEGDDGFAALPGGYRESDGDFVVVDYFGTWWSSGENSGDKAYSRNILHDAENAIRNELDKTLGFSVRCVKND